jgi:hypothetical protein
MRAFLNGQQGNISVPAGSNILGRGQDCGLRIDDPRLSRHHARLLHDGSSLIIEDLGSTNGVLVNGERIHGKKSLTSGDTVVCGPCVFSVALDPTQKASASELVPGTDRKPDPRQTESMDPLELPSSDRLPASKPGRQINPLIAAALSGSGEFTATKARPDDPSSGLLKPSAMASDVSSDVLKPNEQLKVQTAPLIHRSDTTPRGNPIPAPSEIAKERLRDRKDKTTGLIPNDFTPTGSNALQPDFVTPTPGGPAPVWKRCFAGVADSVTLVVLMAVVGLPLIVGGYAWALSQARAVIENGLPQLTTNPGNSAATWDLITSLFHHGGIARGVDIALRLMRADDQQPFLTLFVASALGVLFILVTIIIHLIGATVVRGAPFWHRLLAIEIVEHRTGYHLTWGRSVARWVACAVLWPLAPIALGLDKRSLHDVLTGCAVRGKRR